MTPARRARTILITTAVAVAATAVSVPAAAATAAPSPLYAAADVGLPGEVVGINDRGDLLVAGVHPVAGYVVRKGRPTVVLQRTAGAGSSFVHPTAINDRGVSVGFDEYNTGMVRWSPAGVPTRLRLPAGSTPDPDTTEVDINDNGLVLTTVSGPGSTTQIVEWTDPAVPRVVFTAARGTVRAYAINNHGVVAGVLDDRAFLLGADGRPHFLPAVVGSSAIDVNDTGVALGYSANSALVWDATAHPYRLGGANFGVTALADDGTVVGYRYNSAANTTQAFVRAVDGTLALLAPLRGFADRSTRARCINGRGDVGGVTAERATVWTRTS